MKIRFNADIKFEIDKSKNSASIHVSIPGGSLTADQRIKIAKIMKKDGFNETSNPDRYFHSCVDDFALGSLLTSVSKAVG